MKHIQGELRRDFHLLPEQLQHYIIRLKNRDPNLKSINLARQNIGPLGVKYLVDSLKDNDTVTTIILYGNNIGDEGASYIADLLRDNHNISNLNIGLNDIGNEGIKVFSEALEVNKTLKNLVLLNNKIFEEEAEILLGSIAKNYAISTIYLSDEEGSELQESINSLIATNKIEAISRGIREEEISKEQRENERKEKRQKEKGDGFREGEKKVYKQPEISDPDRLETLMEQGRKRLADKQAAENAEKERVRAEVIEKRQRREQEYKIRQEEGLKQRNEEARARRKMEREKENDDRRNQESGKKSYKETRNNFERFSGSSRVKADKQPTVYVSSKALDIDNKTTLIEGIAKLDDITDLHEDYILEDQRNAVYAILGLERNADHDVVKKAYKKLMLRIHPDKNPENASATKAFHVIDGLYKAL